MSSHSTDNNKLFFKILHIAALNGETNNDNISYSGICKLSLFELHYSMTDG